MITRVKVLINEKLAGWLTVDSLGAQLTIRDEEYTDLTQLIIYRELCKFMIPMFRKSIWDHT